MIRNILLTTDFSEDARAAYPAAVALARAKDATIHLVNVVEPLPPFYYMGLEGTGGELPEGTLYDEGRELLEKEARHAGLQGVRVKSHLLFDGTPHDALARFAKRENIDLIVTATHGRTGLGHLLLGSFAERLVRLAPVPVLTIRPLAKGAESAPSPEEEAWSPRRVVVPFDFSENARAVFPVVQWLAREHGTSFRFVHVHPAEHPFYYLFPSQTYAEAVKKAAENAPEKAKTHFDEVHSAELEGVEAEFESRSGDAADEIAKAAREWEADLILVATHGWTGLKHFVIGSVAEKVLRAAPCPVLTVRPQRIVSRSEGEASSEGSVGTQNG